MLLEFRIKNYLSFKDEYVLSLVASNTEKSHTESVHEANGFKALKCIAIFGPNASGKSNIIRAWSAMGRMIRMSATQSPQSKLPITPFLLSEDSRTQPSLFETVFLHEGVRYQYGFEASAEHIESEWLYAFPKGRSQLWFTRDRNADSSYRWKTGPYLKGPQKSLQEKTRPNVLFLSAAKQWNHVQLEKVADFFWRKAQSLVEQNFEYVTARFLHEATESTNKHALDARNGILQLLKSADLGICDVETKEEQDNNSGEIKERITDYVRESFKKIFPDDVVESLFKHRPIEYTFLHECDESDKRVPLKLEFESSGTKRFFELIGPIIYTFAGGYVTFLDELEKSLHPLLVRRLLELVISEANQSGGQLVFTTHDTTLLDPQLLRRDQVWFTEKDNSGCSSLFPMSSFKPRKNEAFQRGYLSGRYGAIPILERFGLDVSKTEEKEVS